MDKLISVTLGPFFTTANSSEPVSEQIVPLNLAIEWSSPHEARRLLLFRHRPPYCPDRIRLEQIVFRRSDLPCDMECQAYQAIDTPAGIFLPLEALLAALYRSCEIARPLRDLLNELVAVVPIYNRGIGQIRTEGLLTPEAEARGFRLNTFFQESELIYAQLGWESKSQSTRFHVCLATFQWHPDRRLNHGSWVTPREVGVSQILADELHRLVRGNPTALLSEAGINFLKAQFPPTPQEKAKTAPNTNAHEKTVEREV